jgi:hypothetical protein
MAESSLSRIREAISVFGEISTNYFARLSARSSIPRGLLEGRC